jgi:hypothetical protein
MSGSNRRISRSFFSDGEDEDRSGTAAGDGLDRTVSCGNLFCPQQPAVSPRRHWSRPQSSALQRVKYGAPSHSTGNIYQLHGAELPRSRFVRIRNDEQRPVKKRRRSGLRRAYTRSLDDGLDKPEIMGQLRMNHSGLSSQEDLPHEKVSEDKSSVNDFPVNTESDLHLESTGDELEEDPSQQTKKHAFGPIELVFGLEVATCKCISRETCTHRNYWRGLITKDWSMRLFHDEREINFPPSSNPL